MELGWVDFSEAAKKRVLRVLEYFEKEGAVDELGVGVVRDSFANYFFPGTSTLHTKAKYFFIIPYILKELESVPEQDVKELRKKLDRLEKENAQQMLDGAGHNKDKIIYPVIDGSPCLPSLFSACFREELLAVSGDAGGRAVRIRHPEACIELVPERPGNFLDVDVMEDYQALQNRLCP